MLPKRIEELKKRKLEDIAWFNKKNCKKDKSLFKKILKLGFDYSSNLMLAYLWNIIFLPKTLYIRFKKKGFI